MSNPETDDNRDAKIWKRRQAGETYLSIGRELGLSASRVRHICNRRMNRAALEMLPPEIEKRFAHVEMS